MYYYTLCGQIKLTDLVEIKIIDIYWGIVYFVKNI